MDALEAQVQALSEDVDEANRQADDLRKQVERLTEERTDLLGSLETKQSECAQLQQQLQELQARLASLEPIEPATPAIDQAGTNENDRPNTSTELVESEPFESDRADTDTDTQLLTPADLAKLFPIEIEYDQRARDWAISALKGNSGKDKLMALGYEAVRQGKNYLFKRIDSSQNIGD